MDRPGGKGSIDKSFFGADGLRPSLLWGLLDQAVISLISLVVSVWAGRTVGAEGLGRVALGVASYLMLVALHRALVVEPLVIGGDNTSPAGDRERSRSAVTRSLMMGAAAASSFFVFGRWLEGPLGESLAAIAPWLPGLLLFDLGRGVLFRERRAKVAAFTSSVWLSLLLLGIFSDLIGSADGILMTWGVAGSIAGALSAWVCGFSPGLPSTTPTGSRDRDGLALWLGGTSVVYMLGFQGAVLLLGGTGGSTEVGSLRAGQALFAPLTLLIPAVNLVALPRIAEAVRRDPKGARLTARSMTYLVGACTLVYLSLVAPFSEVLLALFFGPDLEDASELVVPLSVGQLITASSMGMFLLLKANRQVKGVFVATATGSVVVVVLVAAIAETRGALGTAWALALGYLLTTLVASLWSKAAVVRVDQAG